MLTRASLIKLAAAIGIGAGSATAIHAVTVSTPPSLPTSQIVTTTSTTNANDLTAGQIQRLSSEEAQLQAELNSAKATLASRLPSSAIDNANSGAAIQSGAYATTTSPPPTYATTGASSARSDDGSSDGSKEQSVISSKDASGSGSTSSKTDN